MRDSTRETLKLALILWFVFLAAEGVAALLGFVIWSIFKGG